MTDAAPGRFNIPTLSELVLPPLMTVICVPYAMIGSWLPIDSGPPPLPALWISAVYDGEIGGKEAGSEGCEALRTYHEV